MSVTANFAAESAKSLPRKLIWAIILRKDVKRPRSYRALRRYVMSLTKDRVIEVIA